MTDLLLQAWTSSLIEIAKFYENVAANGGRQRGSKLKLLIAAYNGARNTGEDVRVEEITRQFRQIFGPSNVELSVFTFDKTLSSGYFGDAEQIHFPNLFPPFLYRQVPRYDATVACLGATFSKTFADATATYMIGALGLASARGRISVAYGAEATHTSRIVAGMSRRYCAQSLLIMRNQESRSVLKELGLASEPGTDTAWTFEPHPPEYGERVLRQAGWDGKKQILAICPNNPFWWPVKASVARYLALKSTGAYQRTQYRSLYFHKTGAKARASLRGYVCAIANSVKAYSDRHNVFPILIGMEQLDRYVCDAIAQALGGAAVFTSAQFDMYQLVSILRCSALLVSSRYHGIVTSMAGLVPSAGVTIDARIPNLMCERGHSHLLVRADDPHLEEKLLNILELLGTDREAISHAIGRTVVKNLGVMARMGQSFEQHLRSKRPELPISEKHTWEEYLPPLSANLICLVDKHATEVANKRPAE